MRDLSNKSARNSSDEAVAVVGIGASAGGLAAFKGFFTHLADDTGLAFVIVQHLPPDKKSHLREILERYSPMQVELIEEATPIHPNRIYVSPEDTALTIDENKIYPHRPISERWRREPIDCFFESLAANRHEEAIGIVLSGTRDDGTRGVAAIKNRGGLTFAQSPTEAEYAQMPRNAIKSGQVDLVLPVAEIAERLSEYVTPAPLSVEPKERDEDEAFENTYKRIVARLRTVTGHDFTHYKRSTMLRRIDRRRRINKAPDLEAYVENLEENPEEVHGLFSEVLITVTEFFRNEESFDALQHQVVRQLYANKSDGEAIRVWVPACSSGEEVYSIAILLWEEAVRRQVYPDFKIFATDLDERALSIARRGRYSSPVCEKISEERRQEFFEEMDNGYQVVSELRDRVLFAVHDVLQDPPFARQDLISCRNLLIYLDREAQRRVFRILHYALKSTGRLFLGASEFIGEARDLFSAVDKSHRIYRPIDLDEAILPLAEMAASGGQVASRRSFAGARDKLQTVSRLEQTHQRRLNRQYAPPSVVVSPQYEVVHVAGSQRDFLRVPPGEPTQHLLDMVPAILRLPLRSGLIDVFEGGEPTTTGLIVVEDNGEERGLHLVIEPMEHPDFPDRSLAQVVFEITDERSELGDVDRADVDETMRRAFAQIEEENQRLRAELGAAIDRYETTTEELKTSNEELMTINEELQSTTEELETSKEELQSTNEELTTVNDELSHKINELDEVNSDLRNLLSSTAIGTIFLTNELEIKRFTEPVLEYFNILDTDVGRPFSHITHRLDYDELHDDVREVIAQLEPMEREVRSEFGSCYVVRIHPYRTIDQRIAGAVLTFFDVTERQKAQEQVARSEQLFRTVFENASDSLFLFRLDKRGEPTTFHKVNQSAVRRLGYSADELLKRRFTDIVESACVDLDAYFRQIKQEGSAIAQVRYKTSLGDFVDDEVSSRLFAIGEESTVISVSRDISSHKAHEKMLREATAESERLAELRASFLANMSHEIRTPLTSIIGVSQLLEQRELTDRQRQMVSLIQSSGRRLQETLDSVLDISRLEAGEMNPEAECFDVVAQVREDLEILRPLAAEKGLELQFQCSQSEIEIWNDPGFISRIVYNLVHNAIKFSEKGRILVTADRVDDSVELTVSDTGIGIDEKFLPQLFEKFKQASIGAGRSYEGSGLGLSLVHQLIDLMGGSIEVESRLGEGTTFRVDIPVGAEDKIDDNPVR